MSRNPLVQNSIGNGSAPPIWVPGSYDQGEQVTSPLSLVVYIKRANGDTILDPSLDGTNWKSTQASRYITNPKHLPIIAIHRLALAIKYGISSQYKSDNALFFTQMAYGGAVSAITAADAYVTVTSQTGPGFLFNLVLPTHSAAYRSTTRITVDGIVYTITQSADQTALWRMIIGALTTGYSIQGVGTAAVAGDFLGPNGAWDAGFNRAKIGGVCQYGASTSDILTIPPESSLMSYNMPMLRFESSLLIEMKCNLLSADAIDKQCGVTFRMDL